MPFAELPFLESFDHWETRELGGRRKHLTCDFDTIAGGRTGRGMYISVNGFQHAFVQEYDDLCCGTACKFGALAGTPIAFSNGLHVENIQAKLLTDGRFQFAYRNGAVSGLSTRAVKINTWYYIELRSQISAAADDLGDPNNHLFVIAITSELWINGESVLSHTYSYDATDSRLRVQDAYNIVTWVGPGVQGLVIDDVYVSNGTRYGDVRIACLFPNGDNTPSQWTPSAGSIHYQMVDDSTPDDDSTTLTAASVNDTEVHDMQDIGSFTGTIKAVQALWLVKKSDAGDCSVRGLLKSGAGVISEMPSDFYPSEDYEYYLLGSEDSPFGGAWVASDIDGMKQGIKRIS